VGLFSWAFWFLFLSSAWRLAGISLILSFASALACNDLRLGWDSKGGTVINVDWLRWSHHDTFEWWASSAGSSKDTMTGWMD